MILCRSVIGGGIGVRTSGPQRTSQFLSIFYMNVIIASFLPHTETLESTNGNLWITPSLLIFVPLVLRQGYKW